MLCHDRGVRLLFRVVAEDLDDYERFIRERLHTIECINSI